MHECVCNFKEVSLKLFIWLHLSFTWIMDWASFEFWSHFSFWIFNWCFQWWWLLFREGLFYHKFRSYGGVFLLWRLGYITSFEIVILFTKQHVNKVFTISKFETCPRNLILSIWFHELIERNCVLDLLNLFFLVLISIVVCFLTLLLVLLLTFDL